LCEFWDHCTRDKARDWILRLPRITRKQLETLREDGIERISEIPPDFELQIPQRHMCEAVCRGEDFVAHGLSEALCETGPPAYYLDFETASPVLPLYRGTRPFQNIPFQWSLHHEYADGGLGHRQFLATGDGDPKRDFSESLIGALDADSDPILVYSPFESRVLENLAAAFPDLRDALQAIRGRLVDLLPIVRNCVYHVGFGSSFSIKRVAPALAPGFGYGDLDGVAEGGAAAAAFLEIAAGALSPAADARLREQLLAYCERDTLALVHVHRALRARASAPC
jgi:predicted RecB family nuclease